MISRYEIPAVSAIWTEEEKWKRFLEVELALLAALEDQGVVPQGTHAAFLGVKIRPDRILELEETTRHDVVAFCSSITEQVDPAFARFFHYGATSSDIIDTALSLQVRDSVKLVTASLARLIDTLDSRIEETRDLLCLGRSHGMAAEPMIFGQKFLSFRAELTRRLGEYRNILLSGITGQFSGAVGNYTVLSPEIEARALQILDLRREPASTQVIPRDRIAKIVSIGARTGTAAERAAVEIRHLHRAEVCEVHEGFSKGQTGSSTMPHKKNPVSSENLSGLSRVLRSHESIALENCVLWHERDISHSSAERLYLPDHFGVLVYSIERLNQTFRNLVVDRKRVEENLRSQPKVFSSLILHRLIAANSCPREVLYGAVQEAAFDSSTLEEFIAGVRARIEAQGMTAGLDGLDFPSLQSHYQSRFQEVRARFAEDSA